MNGFFRNPEVLRQIAVYAVAGVLFTVTGYLIDKRCGLLLLCACAFFTVFHLMTAFNRYKKIRKLTQDIDTVLHGNDVLNFTDCAEGELAVLQSELHKIILRLRDAADTLQKDKKWLSDSIADISHQLRTPLTSINLVVTMLSDTELSDARRLELTRELKRLLGRIDWLVESLLKISRIDAGAAAFHRESVPAALLIRKAVLPLEIAMDVRGQTLRVDDGGAVFSCDEIWTAEALGNILKNCMEHTPEDGYIEVKAMETAIYSQIMVHDSGLGIMAEDLPHLFERFYRGKNANNTGYGIGLALARMIVTAQNGTLKAENHPSGGALFTLRFYKETV